MVPFLSAPIEQEPLCGGSPIPVTAVPALSPTGLAALIGLLVLASAALLRRTG